MLGKTGSLLFLQTAMSLSSKLIALLFQDLVVPRFRVCKESGKDGGGGALLKYVLEKSGYAPRAFCGLIN